LGKLLLDLGQYYVPSFAKGVYPRHVSAEGAPSLHAGRDCAKRANGRRTPDKPQCHDNVRGIVGVGQVPRTHQEPYGKQYNGNNGEYDCRHYKHHYRMPGFHKPYQVKIGKFLPFFGA